MVKNSHLYGLNCTQYRKQPPSKKVPSSLAQNFETEIQLSSMDSCFGSITTDVSAIKANISDMKLVANQNTVPDAAN